VVPGAWRFDDEDAFAAPMAGQVTADSAERVLQMHLGFLVIRFRTLVARPRSCSALPGWRLLVRPPTVSNIDTMSGQLDEFCHNQ
jgi:hypothetical protein